MKDKIESLMIVVLFLFVFLLGGTIIALCYLDIKGGL